MKTTIATAVITLLVLALPLHAQDLSRVEIPYQKKILDNGLTVLVHEDDSAPVAYVIVFYKVGSRDESLGKTGYAHLFEHMMFNGSENYDKDYFTAVQSVGGLLNGDTWFDRTRYYQTVPNTAVDKVLWLESDRMGHFLGALTQEKLDNQRGVVQNEKRRGDNRPYAMGWYRVLDQLFPKGHPYSWSTIGSMEDLNAASLEDMHAWFRQYYGAGNAIVGVAGDVDAEAVFASVERYFGDIDAGPPVSIIDDLVPVRAHVTTEVIEDRVPHRQLQRHWVGPGRDHRQSAALWYAAQSLGGDDAARLNDVLVKERKLATEVGFSSQAHDLASISSLIVTLAADSKVDDVGAAIDEVMREFAKRGPTEADLELLKTAAASQEVQRLETINGKMVRLIDSEMYGGDPEHYKVEFAWHESMTASEVREAAKSWFGDNYYQLLVEPFGTPETIVSDVDRSQLPTVDSFPAPSAPVVADFSLRNGVKVRFVERTGIPALQVSAVFDFGRTAEADGESGLYELTVESLDKGSDGRSAGEVAKALKQTGSSFAFEVGKTSTNFTLSTLSSKADIAIELFSDILRRPDFDAAEFAVTQSRKLSHIESDQATPSSLIGLYEDEIIYGLAHPFGLREHGLPESIASFDPDDLQQFHKRWIRPENLTLFVGGDIQQDELKAVLERHFGGWQMGGDAIAKPVVDDAPELGTSRVILFDTPGAVQSNIVALHQVARPYGDSYESLQIANMVYGGSFLSRINMNLREDKGWSYGVRSSLVGESGPGKWRINAQVQTDRTRDSIVELVNELDGVISDSPLTAEEIASMRDETIRKLPATLTTTNAVIRYLMHNHVYGLPDDEIEQRGQRLAAVTEQSAAAAFEAQINADALTWIIAGDLAKVEDDVRGLGLGEVEVWDADGKVLR